MFKNPINSDKVRRYPPDTLLLDSCILQDLGSSLIKEEIKMIIKNLLVKKINLIISDYSFYELLRGATVKKEKEIIEILGEFKTYYISTKVLLWAAWLETLYKNEKVDAGIDDGDKILASTSFLINAPILTRNGQHFPRPFFDDVNITPCTRRIFEFNKQSRCPRIAVVYFLQPNYEIIKKKIKERE